MIPYYLVFNNRELSNLERFKAYLENGWGDSQLQVGADCCNLPLTCDIPTGGEGVFVDPVTDDAPWYKSSAEFSDQFGGMLVTDVSGLGSLAKADSGDAVDGGWVDQLHNGLRVLTFTAVLQARTCCGLQYGLRWLESQLRLDSCGDDSCDGASIFMYDCPPSEDDLANLSTSELLDKYLRVMYGAKFVGNLDVLSREGSCCGSNCGGVNAVIQFSIGVEYSGIYTKPKLEDAIGLSTDCLCGLHFCTVCENPPTRVVDVVKQKTRLPIKVSDDGSWCPIGWDRIDYNIFDDSVYLDVSEIDATRRPYYISVNADNSWTAMGWDPLNKDLCDLDVQIGVVCSTSQLPEGCTEVATSGKRDIPINLTVVSNTGGTWSPVGWVHNPANFPPYLSELSIDLGCESCDGEANLDGTIVANDDGSWYFPIAQYKVSDLWRFDSIVVNGSGAGTFVDQVEVEVGEAVPDCFTGFDAPSFDFPTVEDCYCDPILYSLGCQVIDLSQTGFSKNHIVAQLTAVEDIENVSLDVFYFRYNNFLDPCEDSVEAQQFWHCQNSCAGWQAAQLSAGMQVNFDSALQNISMDSAVDVDNWVTGKGFATFGDCGFVVIRVKVQCDTEGSVDVPDISFQAGVVGEEMLGLV